MIRFAIWVTVLELLLTGAASLLVGFEGSGDPYLTEDELRELGFQVEKYTTQRSLRFGLIYSYDTRFVLSGEGGAITLSVRPGTPRSEYDTRLGSERRPRMKTEPKGPVVVEEPWGSEVGYTLSQRDPGSIRAELVRWREGVLLLVRASRPGPVARPSEEAARYERLARLVQIRALQKFGWRN
jgi:hypothetical protein